MMGPSEPWGLSVNDKEYCFVLDRYKVNIDIELSK